MALNMSKMKKVAGDKDSSTFLHDDGHQIKIAHKALPALQRKQLEQLPIHKADGGDVLESIESWAKGSPTPTPTPTPESNEDKIRDQNRKNFDSPSEDQSSGKYAKGGMAHYEQGTDSASSDDETVNLSPADLNGPNPVSSDWTGSYGVVPNTPEQDAAQQPLTPATAPSVPSSPKATDDINAAYEQGQRAIDEQAKVNANKATAQIPLEEQAINDKKELAAGLQNNLRDFQDHQQSFMNDIQTDQIDPKHYMESMSTPQKVTTAIGLLLGGIGMGLGQKSNPAQDWLNAQISRDIEAQKSKLESDKTLLGANHQLFGDQILAEAQTRVNMNDLYDHQIQLAAAKLGTPQAKANADAQHSQFALQNAQLMNQMALRKTVMDAAQNNGGRGLDPIDLEHAGMIPAGEGNKEASAILAQKNAIAQGNQIFDQMDKEQSLGNILNPQSHFRMNQLKQQLTNNLLSVSPSHRLSAEFAQKIVDPLTTGTFENQQTRDHARQTYLDELQKNSDPTPFMKKYAPAALPNYSTPSAPITKTMNGVKYIQVPGGWKKAQ